MTSENTCRLVVNGEPEDWAPGDRKGSSIAAYLQGRDINPAAPGVAVALNGTVVPRNAWSDTQLNDGDRLELVGIFKGG